MIHVSSTLKLRAAFATDSETSILPLALVAWRCIRADRDPLPLEVEVHLNAVTRQPTVAAELPWLRLMLVLGITVSGSFRKYIITESPLEFHAIKAFYVSFAIAVVGKTWMHRRI
jgi:hypothetical protein